MNMEMEQKQGDEIWVTGKAFSTMKHGRVKWDMMQE